MEKTKEIEIDWNGIQEKVVIKRLTYGERNDLMRQSRTIKIVGTEQITNFDPDLLKEIALVKCITKAPFNITHDIIKSLDWELGDKIYDEIEKLNSISEKKKEI